MTRRPRGSRFTFRSTVRAAVLAAGCAAMLTAGCSCEGPRPRELLREDGIPLVRVKLGRDTPALAVAVAGPYTLRADGRQVECAERLAWTPVRWDAGGIALGPRVLAAGHVEFAPDGEGLVKVRRKVGAADTHRAYRGRLKVLRKGGFRSRPM